MTQSLSATWNEVLVLENVKMFDIGDKNYADYPSVVALLYDQEKRKVILGLFQRRLD